MASKTKGRTNYLQSITEEVQDRHYEFPDGTTHKVWLGFVKGRTLKTYRHGPGWPSPGCPLQPPQGSVMARTFYNPFTNDFEAPKWIANLLLVQHHSWEVKAEAFASCSAGAAGAGRGTDCSPGGRTGHPKWKIWGYGTSSLHCDVCRRLWTWAKPCYIIKCLWLTAVVFE